MKRRFGIVMPVSVLCALCWVARCFGEQTEVMTSSQLLDRIVRMYDIANDDGERCWNELVARGSGILPLVCAALANEENDVIVGRLFGLACEVNGDRSGIREIAIEMTRGGGQRRLVAIGALSKMGERSDCVALVPLLEDPDESVRIAAAETLGVLGDLDTAASMEAALKRIRVLYPDREGWKDYSAPRVEKAIRAIKERERSMSGGQSFSHGGFAGGVGVAESALSGVSPGAASGGRADRAVGGLGGWVIVGLVVLGALAIGICWLSVRSR